MVRSIRPDINTKFHIDFDWWEKENRNFRVYLQSHLCTECRERYKSHRETELIDWIDPQTAEVKQVDALWQSLHTCCSRKPDYITERTPLTAAAFRIFLANNNTPLTPLELHERIRHKSPELIARTLGGQRVYEGIRPVETPEARPRKRHLGN